MESFLVRFPIDHLKELTNRRYPHIRGLEVPVDAARAHHVLDLIQKCLKEPVGVPALDQRKSACNESSCTLLYCCFEDGQGIVCIQGIQRPKGLNCGQSLTLYDLVIHCLQNLADRVPPDGCPTPSHSPSDGIPRQVSHSFAFCARLWTARTPTYKRNPWKYRSVAPTRATNARVGRPQFHNGRGKTKLRGWATRRSVPTQAKTGFK